MSRFLRRWSERKAEARQSEPLAETPAPIDPVAEAPQLTPEEVAQKLAELPAPEEITTETDIRPFLQDFVPAALRNAALRRVWLLDPVISTHLDVARDYAWDFNAASGQGGFAHRLARDVAERSLAALDGQARIKPEETAVSMGAAPDEVPDAGPGPEPAPEDKINPDQIDGESALPGKLKLTSRHGGALPD